MPTPKKPNPTPKPITPEDKRKQTLKNYETEVKRTHTEKLWDWALSEAPKASQKNPHSIGNGAGPIIGAVVATPVTLWMDAADAITKKPSAPRKKGGGGK